MCGALPARPPYVTNNFTCPNTSGHADTSLVRTPADSTSRLALQYRRAVRTAVARCRHLSLRSAFRHRTRLSPAYRRRVEAGTLGTVVGPKRLARRVHLEAEETAALGRFDEESAPDALLAALPGDGGYARLWAVEHGTRLLRTGDAPALTSALEARIFRDTHVPIVCHQLAVDPASCTLVII